MLQSNGQHTPSGKVSTSYFGDTGYDELIRRIRRRERNGSSSSGELEVCHGCPFSEVPIERLPYFDLFPWVRISGTRVARWSKDYSTVLSRDAVAKTFPSAAQAASQIIRVCDLSTAIGPYPMYGATSQRPRLVKFSGMKE